MLLGIRSTFKSGLNCTSSELVYGTTLRLPRGYLTLTSDTVSPASDYAYGSTVCVSSLTTSGMHPSSCNNSRNIFVIADLGTCTHVFVRWNTLKPHLWWCHGEKNHRVRPSWTYRHLSTIVPFERLRLSSLYYRAAKCRVLSV